VRTQRRERIGKREETMTVPSEFGVREAKLVELVVPNDLYSARRSEERIMSELARCRYGADVTFAIKLALEEALTNAVKHGNDNDTSKRLVVRYAVSPERTVIMVRDEGHGFVPNRVPDPTADENLERPSGRGIMLMHAYMTRVYFNEAGNEVWLLKENRARHPASTG
jgi:serine/threonine-protein kinase RsbW